MSAVTHWRAAFSSSKNLHSISSMPSIGSVKVEIRVTSINVMQHVHLAAAGDEIQYVRRDILRYERLLILRRGRRPSSSRSLIQKDFILRESHGVRHAFQTCHRERGRGDDSGFKEVVKRRVIRPAANVAEGPLFQVGLVDASRKKRID